MPYDLVITGGRVIDPGRSLDAQLDLAVENGRIAALGQALPVPESARTIDARGKLVAPGLIDVHTHLYEHATAVGTNPDLAGVRSGVTTLLDAGSGGSGTYEGFQQRVIPISHTRIFSLLHLGRGGLAFAPEIRDSQDVDMDGTIATVERHRGTILGIKVRAVGPAVNTMGVELVRLARRAAAETRTRVMVHIGDPQYRVYPPLTQRLLPLLEPGDIVTHMYTGALGRVLDGQNRVLPEMLEARDKGVVFDVGHGRFNFNFETSQRLLDQGVLPLTVSTDITAQGREGIVKSMTHVMNKFLALGFSLTDVIRMSTYEPAGIVGMQQELGTLAEGTIADVTLLEQTTGDWTYTDSQGERLTGSMALRPVLCFKGGRQFSVDYGPFPWGWLPNPQE